MKSEVHAFGRIIKKYTVFTTNEIKDFNKKYEEKKKTLDSYGPKLAGRLNTELNYTNFLMNTKCYNKIAKCMGDYVKHWNRDFNIGFGKMHLEIISCWVNDMVEGEYNPPHTHNEALGFSTVFFLKVPEFVNDAKDPHKFKDGRLGFVGVDGIGTTYFEPRVGDFFIFEARHQHFVLPFKTKNKNDIRRSMSFNFIINNDLAPPNV